MEVDWRRSEGKATGGSGLEESAAEDNEEVQAARGSTLVIASKNLCSLI